VIDATREKSGRLPFLQLLRPGPYLQAFVELTTLLSRRRSLTLAMAKREVATEHTGKALGSFWGIFQPLFLLAVYAFIYGIVFQAKIGGTFELPRNFTVYLLSGLVPWFAFQLAMTKGVGVISGNANLVKQVVFDLNVLPVASALAACLTLVLGLGFVGTFTALRYGDLPATYALLPFLLVLQFLAMSGFAFALAAVGTFLRDVRDLVQVAGVLLIFLLPIVYLPGTVPSEFNPILWLNPFTYMIYCYQDVLYFGRFEHPWSWIAFPLWSVFAFVAGYRLFRKVRPYFANVL
jgi:lipopolysaccharide transport system permease protein